ncbi:MAG: hypothetical protein JWR63_1770 [Conexibacter sp.]|nr:hypothetical protein [Conexibacter sp.]MCW2999904.1 hypothetical protein [Solirubrobacterales bacterium]
MLLEDDNEAHLSVEAYRRLRAVNLTAGWPEDTSVRRWLGAGSWNDALRRARIAAVPDGDRLVIERRTIRRGRAIDALRLCARELGGVPTMSRYVAWARRDEHFADPDIPNSVVPFKRHFVTWPRALAAAGLIASAGDEPTETADAQAGGYVRAASYRYTDAEARDALLSCAGATGRSPRQREYDAWRQAQQNGAAERGEPVPALPGSPTLIRNYGSWDDALAKANLDRLGGRATRSHQPKSFGGSEKRWSPYELVFILDRVDQEIEQRLTTTAYAKWRRTKVGTAVAGSQDRSLPIYQTFLEYFGSWKEATTALARHREQPDAPFLAGDPRLEIAT